MCREKYLELNQRSCLLSVFKTVGGTPVKEVALEDKGQRSASTECVRQALRSDEKNCDLCCCQLCAVQPLSQSVDWKVPGTIPVKGLYLGCQLVPSGGGCRRQLIDVSLSSMFLALYLSPFLFLKNQ
uniref:Uncharacterized protein n=1 Tax=Pipistrellus kuhlii TaxID=59472 RepID=A0A7J7X044_PIPKU|nr:hypothetical protein mPipKuh1_010732 [Pipistrellus kuhlii]